MLKYGFESISQTLAESPFVDRWVLFVQVRLKQCGCDEGFYGKPSVAPR
jgi:hypothetical protein